MSLTTQRNRRESRLGVIGFRLSSEEARELGVRASALGISAHLLARSYVTSALRGDDANKENTEQLEELRRELAATREDLALATEALLQRRGATEPEKAAKWVKENLNLPIDELDESS